MASHTRYSNNYRPIFDGELLQNDNGYSSPDVKIDDVCRQSLNTPVFNNNLLQQNGGCDCDCGNASDPFVFDMIQKGGMIQQQGGKKIDQIYAIKKLSHILTPLSANSLTKLNIKLFLNDETIHNNNKQYKQYGGYLENLEQLIAPLGKNNLLVLASLLLLHHFAVDSKRSVETNKKILIGGNSFLTSISELLLPVEEKKVGTSKILLTLKTAFDNNGQKGGSQLKNLIAPFGTSAFIATGLLVILQKLFSDKIKEIKTINNEKKVLIGGEVNKNFEKLYNLIGPITFNTFAKESFLKNMVINKKNKINNKS
jgi:hypothetical protein